MKKLGLATYAGAPGLIDEDRPLLPLLKELGVEGVVLDWEKPRPAGLDAVLFRSCWNSHLKAGAFTHWVDSLGIPCWNPATVVTANLDKAYLLKLASQGVPLPRTELVARGKAEQRQSRILRTGYAEFVIKPTISATSYGTFRLRAEDSAGLAAALATIPESMALLVQEFVPEIQTVGEESYIFFDGRFSHAVRKRAKPGDFRVQEEFGGSREGFTATETQIAQAQEILRAGGAAEWLYARVDVIPVAGQMLLMELEAIDPMFYFAWADAEARPRFARAVAKRLGL